MGSAPKQLGRYELLEELGSGGMGVVYRARDPAMPGRALAIKLLQGHLDGEVLQRFRREASLGARLKHSGLVGVYDIGVDEGRPYLVLELLDGVDLAAAITRQGPKPVPEALALVEQLAETLGYVHAEGVVHRDLKPANVMLTSRGPVITDLGLARDQSMQTLTQTGTFLGTPAYMSPEQIEDPRAAGPRSDVYALGAILFATLTGRRPFGGQGALQIMRAVLEQPAPRLSDHASVPRWVDALCARCLEKDPALRPSSTRELLLLLRAGDAASPAPRALPRWGGAVFLAAGLGASLAVLAGVVGSQPRGGQATPAESAPELPLGPTPAPSTPRPAPTSGLLTRVLELLAGEDDARALQLLESEMPPEPAPELLLERARLRRRFGVPRFAAQDLAQIEPELLSADQRQDYERLARELRDVIRCLERVGAQQASGDTDAACATLRAGVAAYPGEVKLIKVLVDLHLRRGDFEEGLALIDAALPRSATPATLLVWKGQLLAAADRPREALELLRGVSPFLAEDLATGLLAQAEAEASLQRVEEARRHLAQAFALKREAYLPQRVVERTFARLRSSPTVAAILLEALVPEYLSPGLARELGRRLRGHDPSARDQVVEVLLRGAEREPELLFMAGVAQAEAGELGAAQRALQAYLDGGRARWEGKAFLGLGQCLRAPAVFLAHADATWAWPLPRHGLRAQARVLFEQAWSVGRRALEGGGDNVELALFACRALLDLEDPAAAKPWLERLRGPFSHLLPTSELEFLAGQLALLEGDPERARIHYEAGAALNAHVVERSDRLEWMLLTLSR